MGATTFQTTKIHPAGARLPISHLLGQERGKILSIDYYSKPWIL